MDGGGLVRAPVALAAGAGQGAADRQGRAGGHRQIQAAARLQGEHQLQLLSSRDLRRRVLRQGDAELAVRRAEIADGDGAGRQVQDAVRAADVRLAQELQAAARLHPEGALGLEGRRGVLLPQNEAAVPGDGQHHAGRDLDEGLPLPAVSAGEGDGAAGGRRLKGLRHGVVSIAAEGEDAGERLFSVRLFSRQGLPIPGAGCLLGLLEHRRGVLRRQRVGRQ